MFLPPRQDVDLSPEKLVAYYNKAVGEWKMEVVGGSKEQFNIEDPVQIRKVLDRVAALLGSKALGSVVDAGAAWGGRAWILLEYFSEYHSFDMMPHFVKEFNTKVRAQLQSMYPNKDIKRMVEAKVKNVDAKGHIVIFCHYFMCHFNKRSTRTLLRKMATWLLPEGVIVIREPRVVMGCCQLFQERAIIVRRSPEEWTMLFTDAGLEIVETI